MGFRIANMSLIFLLIPLTTGTGQEPKKRLPAWEGRDILGRPIPWGKEVGGQRVCLWMPTTRLLYGQPIDVLLQTAQATDDPPHLNLEWEGPHRTIFFEWTNDRGEAVIYARENAGLGSGLDGNFEFLRLKPTGGFARGRYLMPGKYRMRVTIDQKRWPIYPLGWVGRAESNVVDFIVLDSNERGRNDLVPEAIRATAAPFVAALDNPKSERRDQAEKALAKLGPEVLLLVEPALESPSAEARNRARRIFRNSVQPLVDRSYFWQADRNQATGLLAPFGEAAWKVIGENVKPERLQVWRVEVAKVGPVQLIPEGDPLLAEVVRRLIADLNSPEAHVRVAAMRTMPRTTNEKLLTALVERLADPYQVFPLIRMVDDPVEERLVAREAYSAVAWQGKPIIGPLLTFVRQEKNRRHRRHGLEILGMIGPDPRTFAFVREALASATSEERTGAVYALGMLGPEALPDLIKLAEAGIAGVIQELARHGNAKTVGPSLIKLLRHNNSQIVLEAIRTVEKLDLREAASELKRLVQDARAHQTEQAVALQAYARLADREDAARLLLGKLRSTKTSRGSIAMLLAEVECREAVPLILELLSDPEWVVRAQADCALRGLAHRPQGVGYDAYRPDPALWRKWWNQP